MENEPQKKLTVCYFGNYNPGFSRNKIYISGLRQNDVQVIECNDTSWGIVKYWKLWRQHRRIRHSYDVMVVGYPGHVMVPFARMITKKMVILDALGTLYEAETLSHRAGWWKRFKASLADWMAFNYAHLVLVESEPQRQFCIETFGGDSTKLRKIMEKKIKVLHIGADNAVFSCDLAKKDESEIQDDEYIVIFRGSLTPEAGTNYVLDAAYIFSTEYPDENVRFRIVGHGIMQKEVKGKISDMTLPNLDFVTEKLTWADLVEQMCMAKVSLGQFGHNARLQRTIPHKAFESLALGLPYVSAQAEGVRSILKHGETCLLVDRTDPYDLVNTILRLKRDPELAKKISANGWKLYQQEFTPKALGRKLKDIIFTYYKKA